MKDLTVMDIDQSSPDEMRSRAVMCASHLHGLSNAIFHIYHKKEKGHPIVRIFSKERDLHIQQPEMYDHLEKAIIKSVTWNHS